MTFSFQKMSNSPGLALPAPHLGANVDRCIIQLTFHLLTLSIISSASWSFRPNWVYRPRVLLMSHPLLRDRPCRTFKSISFFQNRASLSGLAAPREALMDGESTRDVIGLQVLLVTIQVLLTDVVVVDHNVTAAV